MAEKKSVAPVKKIPRQKSLPGMADTKIAKLETLAYDYAEIRDQRQALTLQEVELKTNLIEAMHKAGKTEYKRGGISIKLVAETEKVKVRVSEDDTPADNEPAPAPNVNPESLSVNSEA